MLLTHIILYLTVYRLTRLITRDKLPFIEIPREAFVTRWGVYVGVGRVKDDVQRNWLVRLWRWFFASEFPAIGGKRSNLVMKSLAYLWECDWCMSMWVSAGVIFAATHYISLPQPWLFWLAASGMTGLLTKIEEKLDKE